MNSQPIYIQSNNEQPITNNPFLNQVSNSHQDTQQTEIPPQENNEDLIMDLHSEMGEGTVARVSDSSNSHSNSVCTFSIVIVTIYIFEFII